MGARLYQRAISREEWCIIRHELETFEMLKPGLWWISAGKHPCLGCVTAIEDDREQIMLFSENPIWANDPNFVPEDEQPVREAA
jgi:hypothetical protein